MSNYSEFFLNSNSNIVQLELLEISHPSFSQVYRIVRNAIAGATVKIEDGSTHFFSYYPVKITPSGAYNDIDETLQVSFGDLGQILPKELDSVFSHSPMAGGSFTKPILLYRTYRSDDLTAPLAGPYKFEVNNIAFNLDGATLQCSVPRLNLIATGEIYTMDHFPMLQGFL